MSEEINTKTGGESEEIRIGAREKGNGFNIFVTVIKRYFEMIIFFTELLYLFYFRLMDPKYRLFIPHAKGCELRNHAPEILSNIRNTNS